LFVVLNMAAARQLIGKRPALVISVDGQKDAGAIASSRQG
jgi:hypothetical protein